MKCVILSLIDVIPKRIAKDKTGKEPIKHKNVIFLKVPVKNILLCRREKGMIEEAFLMI